jgi:predicted  nucleic acid-binding Zn-ribbon protein
MVFDWTDQATGKSVRMQRDDMAELQTIVARELGLERGVSSSVKHLNSIQFKTQQEEEDLKKVFKLKNGLPDAFQAIEQGNEAKRELEPLKTQKKELEDFNSLLRANKEYLEQKSQEERVKLKELQEQTRSKGMRR